ncbi:hypothetical protein B0H13DRAFT_2521241 [Mycena leptocephala]|nr:hypothetical protein B0H13DRAFT_2521241 [Mycena leptocephala]
MSIPVLANSTTVRRIWNLNLDKNMMAGFTKKPKEDKVRIKAIGVNWVDEPQSMSFQVLNLLPHTISSRESKVLPLGQCHRDFVPVPGLTVVVAPHKFVQINFCSLKFRCTKLPTSDFNDFPAPFRSTVSVILGRVATTGKTLFAWGGGRIGTVLLNSDFGSWKATVGKFQKTAHVGKTKANTAQNSNTFLGFPKFARFWIPTTTSHFVFEPVDCAPGLKTALEDGMAELKTKWTSCPTTLTWDFVAHGDGDKQNLGVASTQKDLVERKDNNKWPFADQRRAIAMNEKTVTLDDPTATLFADPYDPQYSTITKGKIDNASGKRTLISEQTTVMHAAPGVIYQTLNNFNALPTPLPNGLWPAETRRGSEETVIEGEGRYEARLICRWAAEGDTNWQQMKSIAVGCGSLPYMRGHNEMRSTAFPRLRESPARQIRWTPYGAGNEEREALPVQSSGGLEGSNDYRTSQVRGNLVLGTSQLNTYMILLENAIADYVTRTNKTERLVTSVRHDYVDQFGIPQVWNGPKYTWFPSALQTLNHSHGGSRIVWKPEQVITSWLGFKAVITHDPRWT